MVSSTPSTLVAEAGPRGALPSTRLATGIRLIISCVSCPTLIFAGFIFGKLRDPVFHRVDVHRGDTVLLLPVSGRLASTSGSCTGVGELQMIPRRGPCWLRGCSTSARGGAGCRT